MVDELERDILNLIAKSPTPIGATTLQLMLQDRYRVKQAWIGRKLKELDHKGLTQKCGFKGRILTDKGRAELARLNYQSRKIRENSAFLKVLTIESGDRLIKVLSARRALERETAYLAAMYRTEEELGLLERALEEQQKVLDAGGSGAREDIRFHDLISRASKNEVLVHALRVVRHASRLTPIVAWIRKQVGGDLGKEHRQIWQAIRDRDPVAASKAMDIHITNLIQDVQSYLSAHSASMIPFDELVLAEYDLEATELFPSELLTRGSKEGEAGA